MQEYLQHLIPDPDAGYLFPHTMAMGAFGVQKEYHLLKHRPKLVENQHWCKLKGLDHVFRIYYTLAGLLRLADLINTLQAQAFKQALIQHCQGSAIVKSQPAPLYTPPAVPTNLPDPATATAGKPNFTPSKALTPADPAYALAQISCVMEQAIASRSATPSDVISPGSLSPQATAAMIFEAQRVVSEQIFEAQRLASKRQPSPEIHVTVNLWNRWNSWLNQQNAVALSLIGVGAIALIGVSSWVLVASAVRTAPAPSGYSTQSTWR